MATNQSNQSTSDPSPEAPLAGIKVVEFTHMVMGPSAGVILGDLGADVVKVEPLGGDKTRRLRGSGAGYFPMYNRNKRSIALDLKHESGKAIAQRLIDQADVLIENFRPGAMDRLGFGYDALSATNPRLIYCSAKGFLTGPYDQRTALDEVTQMMGGLAYMTGPPGRPLRAGSSVIDVVGGMFGVIGILAAIEERHRTGHGKLVTSSLFESTVFLVGQHMAQYAVTGEPAKPMPVRISAWAIYDIFATKDGEQVFVAVVSDSQWLTFCEAFGLEDLAADESLRQNGDRVGRRDEIIPRVTQVFGSLTKRELMQKLEACGLPFAGIGKPEEMFDDPHLNYADGLMDVTIPGAGASKLPSMPIEFDGRRVALQRDIPEIGADTHAVLTSIGFTAEEIAVLLESGIIETPTSS